MEESMNRAQAWYEWLDELINDFFMLTIIKELYYQTINNEGLSLQVYYNPKVKNVLKFLESQGYVKEKDGTYFLTDSGIEMFEMFEILDISPKFPYSKVLSLKY